MRDKEKRKRFSSFFARWAAKKEDASGALPSLSRNRDMHQA